MGFAPSMSYEDGIAQFDNNLARARAEIEQSGFYLPPAPTYDDGHGRSVGYTGQLPPDLTKLTDDQLGWYLTMLSRWNEYVQVKLAIAQLEYNDAKARLEFVSAKVRLAYAKDPETQKKLTNPERDDYTNVDSRYVNIVSYLNYKNAIYRITAAIANSAETSFTAVSRRITQRGQEIERERRNVNVGRQLPTGGPMFRVG